MDTFRSWQKMYEKVNRKKKDEEEKYVRCRDMTMCVKADGEKMEEMLTASLLSSTLSLRPISSTHSAISARLPTSDSTTTSV